jgi:hypothetical protein
LRLRDVILAVFSAANRARVGTDLPVGSAKGSLTYDGATAELKFAAAFVDQKDERQRIVPVISDQKLRWKNGFAKFSYFFRLTAEFTSTDPPPFYLLPFNF